MADWRQQRKAELFELRHNDPAKLIALYREAANIDELGELPAGLSFARMIDTILDHETSNEDQRQSA